jgi:hypothetical protein
MYNMRLELKGGLAGVWAPGRALWLDSCMCNGSNEITVDSITHDMDYDAAVMLLTVLMQFKAVIYGTTGNSPWSCDIKSQERCIQLHLNLSEAIQPSEGYTRYS